MSAFTLYLSYDESATRTVGLYRFEITLFTDILVVSASIFEVCGFRYSDSLY